MSNQEKKENKKTKTGADVLTDVTESEVREFVRKLEDPSTRTFDSYEEFKEFRKKGGKL